MNPSCSSKSDTARVALFALLLTAVSLALHLRFVEYADDDAYIHMRVARNFWLLGEPYFNIGERVMASTSPLWILLTSPFGALGNAQPFAIAVFNAFILVGAAITWGAAYSKIFQPRCLWEEALAALITFFTLAPASMGLMESPLALFLAGAGLLGVFKNTWWGMPAAIAAIFVRPECAVFCVSALVLKWMRRSVWSRGEILASVVALLSVAMFQFAYYGTLYPHTARVKEIVYQLTGEEFVRALFASGYGEWVAKRVLPWIWCAVFVVLLLGILRSKEVTGAELRGHVTRLKDSLVTLALPAIVIIAVYAVKGVLVFSWYAPLFLVPAHLAFLRLFMAGGKMSRILAGALLAPLFITSVSALAVIARPAFAVSFEAGARARHLKRVGDELARELSSAVMMAPEIGALGFGFKGKIIDAVGLASPEALQFHPLSVPEQRPSAAHGGVPATFVARERPDLIVGLDAFMVDFLKSGEASGYEIRSSPPVESEDLGFLSNGTVFGSKSLVIAVRKGK